MLRHACEKLQGGVQREEIGTACISLATCSTTSCRASKLLLRVMKIFRFWSGTRHVRYRDPRGIIHGLGGHFSALLASSRI